LGNNHWLGSQKGCESAQQPLSLAMSDRYHRIMLPDLIQSVAPFDLEYRLVYAKHTSKWQIDFKVLAEHILHIGLCVPSTCTKAELFNLTVQFFDESAQHTILNEYDLTAAQVLEVKDFKVRDGFFLKKTVIMVG
jgi:Nose resistant-to-fluoxetine protein, N-terminal domain